MKNRNNIGPIHVTPKPGKITVETVSIEIGKPKEKDTTVTIKNPKSVNIKKSSGQKVKESFTLKYRKPYVDPEFVKMCYESNPEHARCLRFVSKCIIGLGLNIEPVDSSLKDFTNDPEYIKLKDFRDNPVNELTENLLEVLVAWVLDYRQFGLGLLEVVKNRKGELAELYYFRAYEARIVYTESRDKLRFVDKLSVIQLLNAQEASSFPLFNEQNFKDPQKERSVFLLKNINPYDRFYGFPDWYSATGKLALARSIDEFNLKGFKNDLMISFAIVVEGGELSTDGLKKIKEFLQNNYKGVQNANKVLYIASDDPNVKIHIEKIQKEGREASFIKTQAAANSSIIISHGVVGSLLGISEAGKLGNSTENRDLFKVMNETEIKPEQKKIADKLNYLVKVGLGITKFKYVPVELTFESLEEMIKFATETVRSGLLEETEGRQYLGYEPKKDTPSSMADKVNKAVSLVKSIKAELQNV